MCNSFLLIANDEDLTLVCIVLCLRACKTLAVKKLVLLLKLNLK